MKTLDIVIVAFTLVVIVVIFLIARRRTGTLSEYFLGGRKMGGLITAFTWSASAASAGLFIGAAGVSYTFGWAGLIYQVGALTGILLTWLLIAPRLRRISAKIGAFTTPDFIAKRFGADKAKLITSIWILVFTVPMMIVQFKGAALIFQTYLGVSYTVALIIFGVIVAVFTTFGGYFAVAWLDTVQGIIMTIGMLIILPVGLHAVGGLAALNNSLREINPLLVGGRGFMPTWLFWGLMLVFFVAFWGQPHLAHRFYTLKDDKAARVAFPVTMFLVTLWLLAGSGMGLIARVLFPGLETGDLAMPTAIRNLLPISGIIVVLALLSAAMSTLDSLLLTVGTSFSHDILKGYIKTDLSEKSELVLSKIAVAVICILAFALALKPPALITVLNGFAFGAFAIVLGFPLLAGAFFKKANKYLVSIAITLGPAVYIVWRLLLTKRTGFPEMAATILIVVPIMIIVNALTPKPDKTLTDRIFD